MSEQREMPKYESHKVVHALKLRGVNITGAGHEFIPDDRMYGPIFAANDAEVSKRCRAKEMDDPGYYVVYPDGFVSWSPTEAFESGYHRWHANEASA